VSEIGARENSVPETEIARLNIALGADGPFDRRRRATAWRADLPPPTPTCRSTHPTIPHPKGSNWAGHPSRRVGRASRSPEAILTQGRRRCRPRNRPVSCLACRETSRPCPARCLQRRAGSQARNQRTVDSPVAQVARLPKGRPSNARLCRPDAAHALAPSRPMIEKTSRRARYRDDPPRDPTKCRPAGRSARWCPSNMAQTAAIGREAGCHTTPRLVVIAWSTMASNSRPSERYSGTSGARQGLILSARWRCRRTPFRLAVAERFMSQRCRGLRAAGAPSSSRPASPIPTYRLTDGAGGRYVLRRKPTLASGLPSAHAVDREFR